jgi:hypothetical protein
MCQWSLGCFPTAYGWWAVACGTREGVLGFVIAFLLFLNNNALPLYLLLVAIYGVKSYLFS